MSRKQLETAIIRLYGEDGFVTGTGFYIGNGRIITCVHTVANALNLADVKNAPEATAVVQVEFPFAGVKHQLFSRIVAWQPDVQLAGLELLEPPPEGVEEVWLIKADELTDHPIESFGFPDNKKKAGVWVSAVVQNRAENGWFPVESLKGQEERIRFGHGGALVWDQELEGVVGMVVMAERKPGVNSPHIILANQLTDAWDALPQPRLLAKLHRVSQLPPHYLPRDEALKELKAAVLTDKQRPVVVTGQNGWSGIGKSTLVTALARDKHVRHAFPDGVFGVHLGEKPDLLSLQMQLAEDLGGDFQLFHDVNEGRDRLCELLTGKKCLVMLHDVWEAEHATAFDLQDTDYRAQVVMTSPNENLSTALGAVEYQLSALSDYEAMQLFADWTNKDVTQLPEYAQMVARECANLPLALTLCATLVRNDTLDWDDLLTTLNEAGIPERDESQDDEDAPELVSVFEGHPQMPTMKAMWTVIDSLSTDALYNYSSLAVFPNVGPIPEAAVLALWSHMFDLDKRYARRALNELAAQNLLEIQGDAPQRFILFHDMQYRYLRETADKSQILHKNLLDAYKELCHEGWSDGPNDGYFYQNLAYHLVFGGRVENLRKLLLDFDWLMASLSAVDARVLIATYDLLPDKATGTPHKLVQGVLRDLLEPLSLREGNWAGELADALLQLPNDDGLLTKLQTGAKAWQGAAWLRPFALNANSRSGAVRPISAHADEVNGLAITPDGGVLISASADRTLKVWSINNGNKPRTLQGHFWAVTAVAVTPDGRYAVSASWDNNIKVWRVSSGEETWTLKGHKHMVHALDITPDGKLVVSASLDRTIKVWNLETYEEIRSFGAYTPSANTVAITPDGRYAITDNHKTLNMWDIKSGEKMQAFKGHAHLISSVIVTPDGKFAVSGSYDETVKVWDIESGQSIHTLRGHKDRVNAVAVTPDSQRIISISEDRTLKVWDMATGELQATFRAGDALRTCTVAPDGLTIITGDQSGRIHFLQLELPTG